MEHAADGHSVLHRQPEGVQISSHQKPDHKRCRNRVRPLGQSNECGSLVFVDGPLCNIFEISIWKTARAIRLFSRYHCQDIDYLLIFRSNDAQHKPPFPFKTQRLLRFDTVEADMPTLEDVLKQIINIQDWKFKKYISPCKK